MRRIESIHCKLQNLHVSLENLAFTLDEQIRKAGEAGNRSSIEVLDAQLGQVDLAQSSVLDAISALEVTL